MTLPTDKSSQIDALFNQALRYHQQEEFASASKIYLEILSQEPKHADAHHLLANTLVQQGDYVAALTHMKAALAVKPQEAIFHNTIGNIYKCLNRPNEAMQSYQQALKQDPDLAEVHNNLATILLQQGDVNAAIRHYAMAVNLQPAYSDAHYNLGLLFIRENKLPEAITQFRNVVTLNPYHIAAKKYLADLLLTEEKPAEAKRFYQEILQTDSKNVDVLNNMGVALLKLGQQQEAIDYFTEVLFLDENHIDARNNLAAMYLQNNRYQNAVRHYQFLLDKNPDDVNALYNIAVAQMAIGELDIAMKNFANVLRHDPTHTDAICNLAAIYVKLGRIPEAIDSYQKAQQLKPNDSLVNYMLDALTQEKLATQAPENYVTNLFDNYAGYYDKHVGEVLHYQAPTLIHDAINYVLQKKTFAELPDKLTILDLGCGTGLSGQMLRDKAKSLIGVDLAAKMLDLARLKNCYNELICADITKFLTTTDQMFDLIVAADVLVYLGDLAPIFHAVKKHLPPKGLFAFTVEAIDSTEQGDFVLRKTARFAHDKQYLIKLAEMHGFTVELIEEVVPRYQENRPLPGYVVVLAHR